MDIVVKKSIAIALMVTVMTMGMYVAFEPTVSSAVSDDITVSLTVSSQITLSTATNTSFSRALSLTENTAVATASWNVVTNDNDGYTLTIRNSGGSAPALKNITNAADGHFQDYTPASAGVPETWSVPSGAKEFGVSAYGSHTSGFGSDSDCVAGDSHTPSADLTYRDLSTSAFTVASSTATTTLNGAVTTVCFAVEQDGTYAADGSYQATVEATATAN